MAEAKLPAHPMRLLGLLCIGYAVVALVVAITCAMSTTTLALLVFVSALAAWFGARILRDGPIVQRVNLALERLNRGNLEEAEAVLDAIPPGRRTNQLRRSIETQRSIIAFRRKDAAAAVRHATSAIEGRASPLSYADEQRQILAARSLRAIAAAGMDDTPTVRADIEAVRTSAIATPDALARASLAEAIGLSRTGEREKLAAILARDRKLLLEFTSTRDRALVRALQRTLYVPPGSAYREPAPRDVAPETELASWISHVAPAATGLSTSGRAVEARAGAGDVAPPTEATAKGAEAALRKRGITSPPRALGMWLLLMVGFVAVWQLLQPREDVPSRPPSPIKALPGSPLIYVVLGVIVVAALVFYSRRGFKKLAAATRLLVLADLAPAESAFQALIKHPQPMIAAQANSQLAWISTRRANFADALARVEHAIGRVANNVTAKQFLVPALLGQRAYLLAALDRTDEAFTELATLAGAYSGYPFLAGTQLRTRMLIALRQGELTTARALASDRPPDLPMGLHDELLADIVTATADARPVASEIDRLHGELREDPELHAWLRAVWPGGEHALNDAKARAA